MLNEAQIQAAANRIAEALNPEKIILFGSYARGTATEHSDLDLMVIVPEGMEWNAMTKGRSAVGQMGVGVDILAFDKETFDHRANWCSSPIHWAQVEGKVLYEKSDA